MRARGKVKYDEWKKHRQVGKEVHDVQRPRESEELEIQERALPTMSGQTPDSGFFIQSQHWSRS